MLGEIDVALLFQTDSDLIEMRKNFHQVFFDVFNDGFKQFIEGNWSRARKQFRQVESIKRSPDTPTKNLLEFMAKYDYVCPPDWKGYRLQSED